MPGESIRRKYGRVTCIPEFIQSVDSQLKPNEQYYVDIPYMSDCIARYMTSAATVSKSNTSFSAI